MKTSTPLTYSELADIDHLYTKADTILAEARSRLNAVDYDLAVRRAQESFELSLKSIFRFLQAEYPITHDVKKELYVLSEGLKEYPIEKRQIGRLVLGGSVLNLWRSPAFYGDEKLQIGRLFDKAEADLAISYADSAHLVAAFVRHGVYQKATAR